MPGDRYKASGSITTATLVEFLSGDAEVDFDPKAARALGPPPKFTPSALDSGWVLAAMCALVALGFFNILDYKIAYGVTLAVYIVVVIQDFRIRRRHERNLLDWNIEFARASPVPPRKNPVVAELQTIRTELTSGFSRLIVWIMTASMVVAVVAGMRRWLG